jgi:hypothetical protein
MPLVDGAVTSPAATASVSTRGELDEERANRRGELDEERANRRRRRIEVRVLLPMVSCIRKCSCTVLRARRPSPRLLAKLRRV